VKTDLSPQVAEPRTRDRVRGSAIESSQGGSVKTGRRLRLPLTVGVLIVASVVLYGATAGNGTPLAVSRSHAISERALEQEFGLRIDLVGMSAGGGLIDFRFTVLEPEKAAPLFAPSTTGSSPGTQQHAKATLPVLFAEDSNTLIQARGSMGHHQPSLAVGKTFFILYPNPGGKIQSGTPVSIVLGSVRVEHVMAKT
jgi:hypothetical protein